MRTSRFFALAVTTAVLGSTAGAVHAAPSESQRLRGMEGRSFEVDVYVGDALFIEDNCYTFDDDGVWIDQFALLMGIEAGTWEQSRVGASTSYTANAGPIQQHGTVTPAGGSGVLQLRSESDVDGLKLISTGYEVPSCE